MSQFLVEFVVDGNTFVVERGWKWQDEYGSIVHSAGYHCPKVLEPGGPQARERLSRLILGKYVTLATVYGMDGEQLVCDVVFQGRNLTEYFPEYRVRPQWRTLGEMSGNWPPRCYPATKPTEAPNFATQGLTGAKSSSLQAAL